MKIVLLVSVLITLLTGCAAVKTREVVVGFGDRTQPRLESRPQFVLQEHSSKALSSLAGSDGSIHLFVVNDLGELKHLVVSPSQEVVSEAIDSGMRIAGSNGHRSEWFLIDAIEHPKGTLRVAVNGTQYIQRGSKTAWQKVEGRGCSRYFADKERLFCTFIAQGNDLGTSARKDTTAGLLIILPVWSTTEKRPDKLVLAEEVKGEWALRAVIDRDDEFDIDPDYLLGFDARGVAHVFYFVSRGGGFWWLAGGPGAGGFISVPGPSHMRVARLSLAGLAERSSASPFEAQAPSSVPTLLVIEGVSPGAMPFLKSRAIPTVNNPDAWLHLRPLSRQFSVNANSGEIRGLMWADRVSLDDGRRKVWFSPPGDFPRGLDSNWVSLAMRGEHWLNQFEVVTGHDEPPGYEWERYPEPLARFGPDDKLHLLVAASKDGDRRTCNLAYLVNDGTEWSAPLFLGKCAATAGAGLSLTFDQQGGIFASWNDKGTMVGRFLSPFFNRPR